MVRHVKVWYVMWRYGTCTLSVSLRLAFEVEETEKELLATDGLREVPEDLDVLIAQRDFEGAVDLVDEINGRLNESMMKSPIIREYRSVSNVTREYEGLNVE